MSQVNVLPIANTLRYLASEGGTVQQVLQDVNQFGLAIAGAEACTFWARDDDHVIVHENTAYPVCRIRNVPGARLRILEADRPGLTAYMAYQFLHRAAEHKCFNLSSEGIRSHPAYRQADKEPYFNPYFPISKTSLSILCVPVQVTDEWVGMIKAENHIDANGKPSGEGFSEAECTAFIEYAGAVGEVIRAATRHGIWNNPVR